MSKSLSTEQITDLLKKQPQEKAASWPGKEDLKRLALAVQDGAKTVIFSDGRVFSIRYDTRWDAVFIKPAEGDYVPCGYFDKKKLREALV